MGQEEDDEGYGGWKGNYGSFRWSLAVFHLGVFGFISLFVFPVMIFLFYFYPWYSIPFMVAYVSYTFVNSPQLKFGSPWSAIYDSPLVNNAYAWFPLKSHFCKEFLDDVKASGDQAQYIFLHHPHGVMAEWRVFSYNDTVKVMPKDSKGVRSLGASVLFRIPIVRELALWTGCVDANRATCKRILKEGYSLTIMPGGIEEQLSTKYGVEYVDIHRLGYCKLALEHNVKLVPMYAFGTNDLYYTSSFLIGLRMWIARKLWIAVPFAWGFYSNFVPMRVPQNIVCGPPLAPEPGELPESLHARTLWFRRERHQRTQETLAASVLRRWRARAFQKSWVGVLHQLASFCFPDAAAFIRCPSFCYDCWRYVKRVQELYDKHKATYGMGDRELKLRLPKPRSTSSGTSETSATAE